MTGTDRPTFMEEHGSRWLHRAADIPSHRRCRLPTHGLNGAGLPAPDGHEGDIWQCGECGQRWLIGLACDLCVASGHGNPPTGQCTVGLAWRPITERQARRLLRRAGKARQ
jgi:hypothetical protein